MRPLPLTPDGIADLVHDALEAGAGSSMGAEGAVAEFAAAGGDPAALAVRRSGRTVEARTAGGALRLAITAETAAFVASRPSGPDVDRTVYLCVPRRSLPPPEPAVTVADRDPGAFEPRHRDHLLVDLAVGHAVAAFCVRTGDAELGKRLRVLEGATWPDVLDRLGHALVAASPDRVVITPLGRIEVYGPIPPATGESPDGPHTHLLPALLATGRELPVGVELPAECAPAAAFHLPPGWRPTG